MRPQLDQPLANVFSGCRDYYLTNFGTRPGRRKSEMHNRMQLALTRTLNAMAELHVVKFPGYYVDQTHPGYLLKIDPPMSFRVPYHVVPTFPCGDQLRALWQLSREIRSGNRSVISISGSNVLRQMFDFIADIDFCEYVNIDDSEALDRIVDNLNGSEKLICVKVACGDKVWRYPWDDGKPTKEAILERVSTSDKDKSTMKIDYIGEVNEFGVTEITNVIIFLDELGRSAGLDKTFAAQEAPLVPINFLPNQMNDVNEMGRYVGWLADMIVKLKGERNTSKCIKRSASLSRVLFAPEITNEIIALSDSSPVLIGQKIEALRKLNVWLKPLADSRSLRLSSGIEEQLRKLAGEIDRRGGSTDEPAQKRFDDHADQIATRLLAYVGVHPNSRRAA